MNELIANRCKTVGVAAGILAVALVACLALPALAHAKVVEVAPGDNDKKAIQAVLDAGDDVKLIAGKTYKTNGNIYVTSNTTIYATGATIKSPEGPFRNKVVKGKYKYNSIKNFTVIGGTWLCKNVKSYKKTMIQFTHGYNITLDGLTVQANYEGHALEFIACKKVTVKNCKLTGTGKKSSTSVEEQLQFDVADPVTAPTIKKEYGSKAVAGQVCQDMVVKDCAITGCRGLTTNFARYGSYPKATHKNITVMGCKITGVSSEGMALFNVMGKIKIKNNTIVSKSSRTGEAYSVGLHLAQFGKASAKVAKKTKAVISGNTIKGGRQAFFAYSHSGQKYGKITVTKNKAYCKKGKSAAIQVGYGAASKKSISKNKTYSW